MSESIDNAQWNETLNIWRQVMGKRELKIEYKYGSIGDGAGNTRVTGKEGYSWIRYDTSPNKVAQVLNRYQHWAEDTQVIVGKQYPDDAQEQVLFVNLSAYGLTLTEEDTAFFAVAPHGDTHSSKNTDPAYIDTGNVTEGWLITTNPYSLQIYITGFLYVDGCTIRKFSGAYIDLTAYVPTGANKHAYILVYFDIATRTLQAVKGTEIDVSLTPSVPACPANAYPMGVVDITNGDTEIVETDIYPWKLLWNAVCAEGSVGDHVHSSTPGQGGASIIGLEELMFHCAVPLELQGASIVPTDVYHALYVDSFYIDGVDVNVDLTRIEPEQCGQLLVVKLLDTGGVYGTYQINIRHGVGNIWLSSESDIVLDNATDHIMFIYNGEYWCDLGGVGTGASECWSIINAICNSSRDVRIGLVTKNEEGVAGYGNKLYLSGGPSWSVWNSDNSDPLWLARYNVANDQTELRINIGDNGVAADALVMGYTVGSTWYPVHRFDMAGGGGGGGTFLSLSDTPGAYAGATQTLIVNATNNGLEFSDALQVHNSAPTDSIHVDSTGKVGMGSAAFPLYYLDVRTDVDGIVHGAIQNMHSGTSARSAWNVTGNDGFFGTGFGMLFHGLNYATLWDTKSLANAAMLEAYTNCTKMIIKTVDSVPIIFGTNDIEVARFSGGGRFGLGTDTPNYISHFHGITGGDVYLQFTNTDTGSTAGDGMLVGIGGSDETWRFYNFEGTRTQIGGTGAGYFLYLDNTNGRVGIGQPVPTVDFHVYNSSAVSARIESGGATYANFYLKNTQGEWMLRNNTVGDFIIQDVGANTPIRIESGCLAQAIWIDNVGVGINTARASVTNVPFLVWGAAGGSRTSYGTENVAAFDNNGNSYVAIISANASTAGLHFGDYGDRDIGRINYSHSLNEMMFYVSNTLAWKIISGGRWQYLGNNNVPIQIDTTATSGPQIRFTNDGTGLPNWSLGVTGATNGTTFILYDTAGASAIALAMTMTTNYMGLGAIATPSYRLQLPTTNNNGGKGYAHTFIDASDRRLKFGDELLQNAVDTLVQLRPVRYHSIDAIMDENGRHSYHYTAASADWQYGLIAQEVEPILPGVVERPDNPTDQFYGLSYGRLVPWLIRAIQELNDRLIALGG